MNSKAITFLAFSLGVLLLFHGVDKIMNGTAFIEKMLTNANIPYAKYITYGVFIGEVLAPILLIIGRYVKISGGIIAFNMLVAIFLVHRDTIFTLSEHGGWSIELQLLYFIAGLTLFLSESKWK